MEVDDDNMWLHGTRDNKFGFVGLDIEQPDNSQSLDDSQDNFQAQDTLQIFEKI